MYFDDHPHRRLNQLTGEWVLVSPHRTKRPWQGQQEAPDRSALPEHDPECYLCPGNERAGGAVNPDYDGTFVFINDFCGADARPARRSAGAGRAAGGRTRAGRVPGDLLFPAPRPVHGPPRRGTGQPPWWTSGARSSPPWARGGTSGYVQVFENRGAVMGCSNPHPPRPDMGHPGSVPMYPAAGGSSASAEPSGRKGQVPALPPTWSTELASGRADHASRTTRSRLLVPFWAPVAFRGHDPAQGAPGVNILEMSPRGSVGTWPTPWSG